MTDNEKTEDVKQKKSVFRRVTGIVGYALIFIIATLLIVVISFKATNRTVFIFGKAAVWVLTPSMEPDIPARSYILVSKVDPNDVKEGDIIMFHSKELNGANNTHQVIEIKDGLYYTKGIANPSPDAYPTEAKDIVAIYERNMPVLTAIGRFIMSRIGIIVSLTVIFVIVMIIYMPDIIRATRKKSKELEQKRQARIDELVLREVERLKRESGEAAANQNREPAPELKEDAPDEQPEINTENNNSEKEDIQ